MTAQLPTLNGAHCTLRELTPADAPSLARHADDEAIWRNLFEGFPRPYTLAHGQAWCSGGWRDDGSVVWGIEVEREVVGCVGFRPEHGWLRCNAEIGYWLGRAFWRRGIASEGLRLVSACAFATLPELTRLYASIFSANEGSQAVARKCGYAREGVMRRSAIKNGRVIDRTVYALIREAA